jgi:serine protease Do
MLAALITLIALSAPDSHPATDTADTASLADFYHGISPAIVGIRSSPSANWEENYAFGTGTIVHPDGMVLTSITVVPDDSKTIEVYLRGGKILPGEKVMSAPDKELVLIKIRKGASERRRPFPFLRLGSSAGVRVGELAFAAGNAFHSIYEDDQVTFTAGLLSGAYQLPEAKGESRYIGPVLETSTTVNAGMDGGPLLDSRGAVIGLLSLNYSRNRWLGTAVPIDALKPFLGGDLGWFDDRIEPFPAYVGLEVCSESIAGLQPPGSSGRPAVTGIDPVGPAAQSGIERGDRIVTWDGDSIDGVPAFRARFEKTRPGESVKLGIERGGARREVEVKPWGKRRRF